eukprot:TRINITY_DN67145_c6_g2_i1.p1 TRINITY_DN67145_c6_g2~~TRINITY_DN67145_c6_g2_i1.p1  ORF type:complete len:112 (+),score=0.82 TRINITY_DN67145_c6_g2_i1:63-398(+)
MAILTPRKFRLQSWPELSLSQIPNGQWQLPGTLWSRDHSGVSLQLKKLKMPQQPVRSSPQLYLTATATCVNTRAKIRWTHKGWQVHVDTLVGHRTPALVIAIQDATGTQQQ